MPALTISLDALSVFVALLLAHLLADFVLQPQWMVERKRNPIVFALHVVIVFSLTTIALGGIWKVALPIAALHCVIDMFKTYILTDHVRKGHVAFLADQIAHLATLVAAAMIWPETITSGYVGSWASAALLPAIFVCGLIVATLGGAPAVQGLMMRYPPEAAPDGLPDAGRLIGLLERLLVFTFVLTGATASVGFLIAAKSLYSFGQSHALSQYVIIGTLASFGWGLASGYATLSLLEIAAANP